MCGIYGMVSLDQGTLRSAELLCDAGRSLRHRGPDHHGVIVRPSAALGCERLRVIDLREQADQPLCHSASRCWLVCNGEIYNAAELRRRYRDYPFCSRSDIETILPLYLDRGPEGLSELDGMFAVAIWDEPKGALTLARDRAGEKPLFFSRIDGEIWFASEVQALLNHPQMSRELDETAVFQFLAMGYVPEPRTAFRDVRKIRAGTIVRFAGGAESVIRYWQPGHIAAARRADRSAPRRLRSLLRSAVRKQMTADVPVGIFLSGGIDSSLLAAIADQEAQGNRLHTFVARFSEHSYDESDWATRCAHRLGSDNHEIVVDERSLSQALSAVTGQLAEPLADPAVLPTYLLAREARKHVTVILSGEGADELFGGYPTYLGHRWVPYLNRLPRRLRQALRSAVDLAPASRRKVTLEFLLKRFLADAEKPWLERHLSWLGPGAQHLLIGGGVRAPAGMEWNGFDLDEVTNAMLLDYTTYLRDGLLVKNDRATMLNSVESRAPYLDRDLSEFALTLPDRYKVRRMTTKWLLKKVAAEWLPRDTIYRRKRGLSVPVASWIDRGLRSEVDRLLDPARLGRQDLLDPQRVGRLLAEHRAGAANHARPLWALIVFQYWMETWAPERAGGT